MAYNCPGGCVREQFISNPNLAFNGYPIGTIDANNALSINQTRDAVSQWRPEAVDMPPNANFTSSCNLLSCTFTDTSTSFSPLISWDWDFGDGTTSTAQNPGHNFSIAGTYDVQLTVTDETGASAFSIETVVVSDTQPIPPQQPQAPLIAVSGADVSIDWAIDETASHYSPERYKRHPKSGKWTEGTTIINVTPTYIDQPGSGTFRYRLIAHNAHGASVPSDWVLAEGVTSGGSTGGGRGGSGKGGKNR
jgi:PKD repeat protein